MAKNNVIINSPYSILGNFNASNLLLLNTHYQRPHGDLPDVCTVVYKDTTNGEKHVMEIENPLLRMYVVKDEFRDDSFYPEYMPIEQCDTWTFPYRSVLSQIYKLASPEMKAYVKACKDAKNFYSIKKLHHTPCVLGTDFPYENYFRIEWMLNYADKNVSQKITKQYLDIETDTYNITGMPEKGNCPINAVTIVDEETNRVYTFLLRNKDNPLIEKFEKDIDKFINLCHDSFDESYGHLDYLIYMYDEEIELIKDLFRLINTLKRDFLLVWNLSFDIPFIMDRIAVLGYNPIDIMCSPDFKYPYCYFVKDHTNFDFKTKKDKVRIASYTIFSDQMMNYAKVRKGQAELQSLKLNAIGQKELEDEKLDYSDIATIRTLPYVNYIKFVLYNIKDVLLQKGIENKTRDLETIFNRAYENATDYDSIFSQTIFLKNRVFLDYYRDLKIIKGNNVNIKYDNLSEDIKDYEDDSDSDDEEEDYTKQKFKGFEGALVGDPLLNSFEGIPIYGSPSMFIFDRVVDLDLIARSLYQ
ncbi:MAG: hypothetical protein SPF22_07905 [Candidatus Onthovivens sp.]|nr:hypothetical protein [Candidatus Onthovivens sp.]